MRIYRLLFLVVLGVSFVPCVFFPGPRRDATRDLKVVPGQAAPQTTAPSAPAADQNSTRDLKVVPKTTNISPVAIPAKLCGSGGDFGVQEPCVSAGIPESGCGGYLRGADQSGGWAVSGGECEEADQ